VFEHGRRSFNRVLRKAAATSPFAAFRVIPPPKGSGRSEVERIGS
jgi:hypothetical protein